MSFLSKPIPGLNPANSVVISLTTAVSVAALYAGSVGPISDVHMTEPNDGNVNASIKKAGWKALLLVSAVTFLTRDVNVAYLGGSMIILEHLMYLHADQATPTNGQVEVTPEAYQPATGEATSYTLSAVS